MTREEAIICLQGLLDNPLINKGSYLAQAIEMAIKALEQEPCDDDYQTDMDEAWKQAKREPCDDVVSRQAVLEQTYNWSKDEFLRVTNPFDYLRKRIKSLPSVRPQEQTGKWIIKDGKEQGYDIGGIKTWYIQIMCDKCGFIKTAIEGHTGQYHFCPNCGARMVEPQESEENE